MDLAAPRWWPLALAMDVKDTAPLAARCSGREIVLFRDSEGVARALEDRCAHRRAPLSLGRMMPGGMIACPYHGWVYEGATGRCRSIPNLAEHEKAPPTFKVERFATAERGGFVFVWSGMADEADETLLPTASLFEGLANAPYTGGALLTIGHADFVAALLDAPDLLFKLADVAVVPLHIHGDPAIEDGVLSVERAADNATELASRGGVLPDYPFRTRISATLGTAMARLDVTTEMGAPLFSALIASSPAGGSVTSIRWRATAAGFSVRDHVDPAALLALTPQASTIWREPAKLGAIPERIMA